MSGRSPARVGRRGTGGQRGMSLVELSIAMSISGVVLAAAMAVMSSTLTTVRTVNVKDSANSDLRIVSEAVSRSVRMAAKPPAAEGQAPQEALVEAGPQNLWFYTLINRGGAGSTTGGYPDDRVGIMACDWVWDLWPLIGHYDCSTPTSTTTTPTSTTTTPTSTTTTPTSTTGGAGGSSLTEVKYYYESATGCFVEETKAPGSSSWQKKCLVRTTQAPQFRYFGGAGEFSVTSGTTASVTPFASNRNLTAAERSKVRSVKLLLNVRDPAHPGIAGAQTEIGVTLQNLWLAEQG